MRQLISFKLSSAETDCGALEKPYLCKVSYNKIPAKSPVNGRPVLFAPCMPGAKPTINNLTFASPNTDTGLQKYMGFFSFNFVQKARQKRALATFNIKNGLSVHVHRVRAHRHVRRCHAAGDHVRHNHQLQLEWYCG